MLRTSHARCSSSISNILIPSHSIDYTFVFYILVYFISLLLGNKIWQSCFSLLSIFFIIIIIVIIIIIIIIIVIVFAIIIIIIIIIVIILTERKFINLKKRS